MPRPSEDGRTAIRSFVTRRSFPIPDFQRVSLVPQFVAVRTRMSGFQSLAWRLDGENPFR